MSSSGGRFGRLRSKPPLGAAPWAAGSSSASGMMLPCSSHSFWLGLSGLGPSLHRQPRSVGSTTAQTSNYPPYPPPPGLRGVLKQSLRPMEACLCRQPEGAPGARTRRQGRPTGAALMGRART